MAEDLCICPPSSRENVAFAAFLRQYGGSKCGSWTCVPSFRAPQASTTYICPVIRAEKKLDREQRVEHPIAFATLISLVLLHHCKLV